MKKKKIKNKKVLICGLTYKANVSDIRNSLALKFLKISLNKNMDVEAYDPIINLKHFQNKNISNKIKNLSKYGLIIILVNHSKYFTQLKKHKIKNEKNITILFFNFLINKV